MKVKNLIEEIEVATKWYDEALANGKFNEDVWRSYFEPKDRKLKVKHLYSLNSLIKLSALKFPEPIAIVVAGTSCCGKTTISHKICDAIINSKYLALDHECIMVYKNHERYGLTNLSNTAKVEAIGLSNFSKKIDSYSKIGYNLVIDGLYANGLNRGMILNVLKSKGYKNFVLVNCLEQPDDVRQYFIKMRAAYDYLEENMNFYQVIEHKLNNYRDDTRKTIDYEKLLEMESDIDYVLEKERIEESIKEENELYLIDIQDKHGLFYLGFNYALHWDWKKEL